MHQVHACQISAKSGQEVCQNCEHKKYIKLHKFATCNSNFEKLFLLDMHHLTPNICVEFETNRLVSYSATALQSTFLRATDRRTDGRTDIASDNIR